MNAQHSSIPSRLFSRLPSGLPSRSLAAANRPGVFLAAALLILAASGLAMSRAQAQTQARAGNGAVAGIVTDESGNFIQGAEVRVAGATGTAITAITDRAGQFSIADIPAGAVTIKVDYLGCQSASAEATVTAGATTSMPFTLKSEIVIMDAYKVAGLREGQARAINQQRASSTLMNIVSSDAIGNLPDRTVGEALNRLPGINVVDDQYASIRGTAAQFNAVTLDGDRFTSGGGASPSATQITDDTRAVDLSMIPAEMIGAIEVTKALTPDKEADSFGGIINLVTRSAFDLKKRSITAKLEYAHNVFNSHPGVNAAINYMDVLNKTRTLGLSVSLTFRKEKNDRSRYEITYYDNAVSDPTASVILGSTTYVGNGSTTAGAPLIDIPFLDQLVQNYDMRLNTSDQTRLGANINLDWKPADNTELHLRIFYQNNTDDTAVYRTRVRDLNRFDATSTAQYQSGVQARMMNYFTKGTNDTDTLRLGIDGKTKLPLGTLEYGARYGNATTKTDSRRFQTDRGNGSASPRNYDFSLDRTDPQLPLLTLAYNARQPADTTALTGTANPNYGANGFNYDLDDRRINAIRFASGKATDQDLSANADYSLPVNIGAQRIDIKTGLKYRDKTRKNRLDLADYTPKATLLYGQFTTIAEPRNLMNGTVPTLGTFGSLDEVIDLYRQNPGQWTDNRATSTEIIRSIVRVYDATEDIYAAYLMATTKVGKLEILTGVRYEQTRIDYTWFKNPDDFSDTVNGSQNYGNLFPGLILNYRITPNLVLRAACTHTLARPDYADIVPYRLESDLDANPEADAGTGENQPGDYTGMKIVYIGNPALKAQKSQNFDLSLEYYFKPSGLVSLALFRKNLTDVTYRSQFVDPANPSTIYFQQRNGSDGVINGLEFTYQQAFTFLPGFLGGLGLNANYTLTDGHSTLEQLVPGTTDTFAPIRVNYLPAQPKRVLNVQLWWEKYGVTARVALNYVAEFVRTNGGTTNVGISKNYPATQLDASLSYRINRNTTLYIEGRNLTNEVQSWYGTTPNRPESYTYKGMTITGGIKLNF